MALGELELVGKGPEMLREVYSDRLHGVDQSIHYLERMSITTVHNLRAVQQ
jgi:hypothetical protein